VLDVPADVDRWADGQAGVDSAAMATVMFLTLLGIGAWVYWTGQQAHAVPALQPNALITEATFPQPSGGSGFGFCRRCGEEVTFGKRGSYVAFCPTDLAFLHRDDVSVRDAKP
jgi:hypothetical protein